mgnify:CR=1 FL=1
MAMIINEYVFREFPGMNTDSTCLGAQVIRYIEFLGVGMIMMNGRSEVKGLTTAAGFWAKKGVKNDLRNMQSVSYIEEL